MNSAFLKGLGEGFGLAFGIMVKGVLMGSSACLGAVLMARVLGVAI